MTEQEWYAGKSVQDMLDYLMVVKHDDPPQPDDGFVVSKRQIRLYGAALLRMTQKLSLEQMGEFANAVGAIERYADRRADKSKLEVARLIFTDERDRISNYIANNGLPVPDSPIWRSLLAASLGIIAASPHSTRDLWRLSDAADKLFEPREMIRILREIVPCPHHGSVHEWVRPWLTSDVERIALGVYAEAAQSGRPLDPGGLSILADALEDAGCDDLTILGHLRGLVRLYPDEDYRPGQWTMHRPTTPLCHFLGCWVVDGLLGNR